MTDPGEVLSRSAEGPDIVVRYDGHTDAVVDVFMPPRHGSSDQAAPLVVFVHGGFWRQEFDRRHVRPLANALQQRGFAVAVPEYRRIGGAGGWPRTGYDVERALEVVPERLGEVAPGRIDRSAAYTLAGHSAGGHLALWAGLRAEPGRIGSIVGLAPVTDLRYAASARMGDGAVQALLGGEPDERPDAYADADVLALMSSSRVPIDVTVIQGTDDKQVTVEMNRRVAVEHAHSGLHYLELDGVDHFALIDPLSAPFEAVVLPALKSH